MILNLKKEPIDIAEQAKLYYRNEISKRAFLVTDIKHLALELSITLIENTLNNCEMIVYKGKDEYGISDKHKKLSEALNILKNEVK